MTDYRFIRNFVYLIGGRAQKTGADTGIMRLWAMLFRWRAEARSRGDAFTFIMPREWNDSVREMAALLQRHSVPARDRRVIIAGYSWGAGFGAPRLAREVKRAGAIVDLLILIDPIYRSKLPLAFRLLAFTTWFGIRIPANVKEVLIYRQRRDALKGTRVRLDDRHRTRILADTDLTPAGVTHHSIQYHVPMLRECFDRIRGLFAGATSHRPGTPHFRGGLPSCRG